MISRNLRTFVVLGTGICLGLLLPMFFHSPTNPVCRTKRVAHGESATGNLKNTLGPKKMIFVGVMTAEKFLDNRAKAVYETWGQNLPGKLMFFASSSSKRTDLPVVSLKGVDDSYPPQRKSLMMLKYMHDNFIDQYEWFLRSDDDVYIRTEKLEAFLRTLNSSDDLYIGQAGTGIQKEKGLLGIGREDNYCMGGPSAVLSASTLRKVAPYLEHCLQNLVTTHEDVEVGRCIKKFVGVSCTWAFEMQSLFYHNRSGVKAFTNNLDTKSVRNAITLHPLKKAEYMYRLHSHFMELKILEASYETVILQRRLDVLQQLLDSGVEGMSDDDLSRLNDYKNFQQKMSKDESHDWEMFTPRKVYSYDKNSPEIGMLNPTKDGLNHVLGQTMSIINKEARKVLHRTLEFKRLNHGYKRYHPLYGMQYMLDLLMKYHRHIGYNRRRMTVHVRHHAYLQQPFGNLMYAKDDIAFDSSVNFILPLAGRLKQFKRFLNNFEEVCLKAMQQTMNRASSVGENVSLIVLYFAEHTPEMEHKALLTRLKEKYPNVIMKWINMEGHFSRALALTVGAAQHDKSALLFFCDVDLEFDAGFLSRCRGNTIHRKQVYYPIVFSQFAPEIAFRNENRRNTSNYYGEDAGFWREYAFGITCQYRVDFDAIGGFDTTIQGWGMEDVDLYDRYVASERHIIFRAPDPGLVHIYHEISCDKKLAEKQLHMCYASKAQTYGSQRKLYEVLMHNDYFAES